MKLCEINNINDLLIYKSIINYRLKIQNHRSKFIITFIAIFKIILFKKKKNNNLCSYFISKRTI